MPLYNGMKDRHKNINEKDWLKEALGSQPWTDGF
jgi:hypothetical protein